MMWACGSWTTLSQSSTSQQHPLPLPLQHAKTLLKGEAMPKHPLAFGQPFKLPSQLALFLPTRLLIPREQLVERIYPEDARRVHPRQQFLTPALRTHRREHPSPRRLQPSLGDPVAELRRRKPLGARPSSNRDALRLPTPHKRRQHLVRGRAGNRHKLAKPPPITLIKLIRMTRRRTQQRQHQMLRSTTSRNRRPTRRPLPTRHPQQPPRQQPYRMPRRHRPKISGCCAATPLTSQHLIQPSHCHPQVARRSRWPLRRPRPPMRARWLSGPARQRWSAPPPRSRRLRQAPQRQRLPPSHRG